MRNMGRRFGIAVCSVLSSSVSVFGQATNLTGTGSSSGTSSPSAAISPASTPSHGYADHFGMGVKMSLLGAGIEGAARVTNRTNVRGGFNMFSYSRDFHKDNVTYGGQINFKTIEAHYDVFPFGGGFHLGPGVLVYAVTPITASAAVPGGQSFTLGGTQYYSDTAVPVTGNGNIKFNRAAPVVTIGWGNLVSRKESKHFSVPVELGVAFQGSPKATLNLAGNVCDAPGVNCRSIASDSTVQSHIQSEQSKLNNSMSFFNMYPIISVGFGYKF
jgi:hypothetical protein